jgi:hypothetical protein
MYRTRVPAGKQATEVSRYRFPNTQSPEAAARSFYRDMFEGRELWPTDRGEAARSLWFLIGEKLVEVRVSRGAAHETLDLMVASPSEVAERCWDAGYTIRLEGNHAETTIHVIDPFGRSIALIPYRSSETLGAAAAATLSSHPGGCAAPGHTPAGQPSCD